MIRSRFSLLGSCAILLVLGTIGRGHAGNSASSAASLEAAQQQFLQSFLAAHENKDVEALKALVDWDDLTDTSRDKFLREDVQGMADRSIKSAAIEDIPGLTPRFGVLYNISPEKFLDIVYADPRGDIRIKYPIGRKDDGKCYFALRGLTNEALRSHNERYLKTGH